MLRLLIFSALLFGIFYFFYYKIKKFFTDLFTPEQGEKQNSKPQSIDKGEMVKCPVCETYFPSNTGIKKNGKLYCSSECMSKDNQ